MKYKTTLSLMELTLMLLLFAATAAMCLRAFALSDRLSRQAEQRDRAVLWAQTMAETWKALDGEPENGKASDQNGGWTVCLDENWVLTENADAAVFRAELREEPGGGLLRRARVTVRERESGRCIYELETACQGAA